ncbi:hypothetical protein QQS21_004113 [Conoideocrella luteorostrata]|uniref:Cyclin N-terminal domain-containing protein n=1 Tax=Conoideocrella luteorostrata TaxID=1105319 RepID=A0AAJ0CUY9_9HYPO|nr:hypothetical protein QQS21_004113 [Conoideocrella luteorostrata]
MQREMQWSMRPELIDFLVKAHLTFAFPPETLFLTVNLLDRYCSRRFVYRQHYPLVGCAALIIAAKYEGRTNHIRQFRDLYNMCCSSYDARLLTQMEIHVLSTLEWSIGHPTVISFSQSMVMARRDDQEVERMAAYLNEIALYHRDFVSTKPSTMARSSLALARAILGRPEVEDREWGRAETLTLHALSEHLHHPSQVLVRKYLVPHMSRVSEKLAGFVAEQASMATCSAKLLLQPPRRSSQQVDMYSAPQKGYHQAVVGLKGYLTPPTKPPRCILRKRFTPALPDRLQWGTCGKDWGKAVIRDCY